MEKPFDLKQFIIDNLIYIVAGAGTILCTCGMMIIWGCNSIRNNQKKRNANKIVNFLDVPVKAGAANMKSAPASTPRRDAAAE